MRLIIMFIAIALAAGAFFITMHFTAAPRMEAGVPVVSPQVQVKEAPTTDIYTAKQDIPIGAVIKAELLDLQPWPKNLVLPDMVVAEAPHPGDIVKMITRTPFSKGEPIMLSKLANENDPSFLAASLGEGMRLITIAVDVVSGVGGFIFPGDRVDVLLTHDVPLDAFLLPDGASDASAGNPQPAIYKSATSGKSGVPLQAIDQGIAGNLNNVAASGKPGTGTRADAAIIASPAPAKLITQKKQVTEILVSNARVLATNQKSTAHGGDAPVVPNNVSIEVSPSDAQKIRLSENGNGRISLVLRSLKNKEIPVPNAVPSILTDLSVYKEAPDSGPGQVVVVRGIHSEVVEVSKP